MKNMVSEMEENLAKESLLRFLSNIHFMSQELCVGLSLDTYLLKVNKKHILLDIGEIQKSLFFIVKGAVRSYYLDSFGKDTTSWLLFEGDLSISVYSFFSQKPSFEVLETLEDTSVLVLSYDKLMQLYKQFPEFNYIGRILTESYYIKAEEKANELRVFSATERYQHLIEKYPNIVARIPLGLISSYLGITQSTLSRIRAKKEN
ncbi:Crp/Fnr family transcriptional regulator [Chryseobacterium lactis]|uniref:Crp/Fnr family transcriptional regulator n=1 Tax=Chryseobacterium lactis TaxID=1241981 RepID=A0A3G6RHU0_CHRLC|nr:Crp/Fnr family transcriptional regulator [Chryseobacterium lactis]AZA82387.1 Crp/Fnr family transcriptional regulator [Chryseobacterium lactis]AZB02769.1 Crp/Fnr family transcriptional regulator [Chryseobacterium lactis]PNW13937.1 Crp/Fnr family transcriptional regulator [Chryseobacterium lactis]